MLTDLEYQLLSFLSYINIIHVLDGVVLVPFQLMARCIVGDLVSVVSWVVFKMAKYHTF